MKDTNPIYTPTIDNYRSYEDDDVRFIPTGIRTLDKAINDLATKEVTVVTGKTKEGKSTFIHRIMLNAIDKGYCVLLVDGEHNITFLINSLYRMVIGNSANTYTAIPYNKKKMVKPKYPVLEMITNWHKDKLHIFTKYLAPINTLEDLFDFTKTKVGLLKVDLVIFDNLMVLVDGTQAERTENQSRFMKRVTDLAKSSNVHCIVASHPNKEAKSTPLMNVYDVSGSSDIVNLTSNLIQVVRNFDESKDYDGLIRLMLNRLYGDVVDIPTKFDKERRCLFEMNGLGDAITYDFNWQGKGKQIKL